MKIKKSWLVISYNEYVMMVLTEAGGYFIQDFSDNTWKNISDEEAKKYLDSKDDHF